jgi:hypothetical protein
VDELTQLFLAARDGDRIIRSRVARAREQLVRGLRDAETG